MDHPQWNYFQPPNIDTSSSILDYNNRSFSNLSLSNNYPPSHSQSNTRSYNGFYETQTNNSQLQNPNTKPFTNNSFPPPPPMAPPPYTTASQYMNSSISPQNYYSQPPQQNRNSDPYQMNRMSSGSGMSSGYYNSNNSNTSSSSQYTPPVADFKIGTFTLNANGYPNESNSLESSNSSSSQSSQSYQQNNSSAANQSIRETGIIEKLLQTYGFIQCCERQARLFFHFSQFDGNTEHLRIGDPVEFEVTFDRRTGKPIASSVTKISPEVVLSEERVMGLVTTELKSETSGENQGRITYENRGECFFLPYGKEDVEGYVTLKPGDKVSFQIATNQRNGNLAARHVRLENPVEPVKYQGVVSAIKDSYGFIERADVVDEIFFHFSEAKTIPEGLKLGDDVEFLIQTRNGKEVATNMVRLTPGTVVFEDINPEEIRGQVLKPVEKALKNNQKDPLTGRIRYRGKDRSEIEVKFGERDQKADFTLRHGDWVKFNIATDRRDSLQKATNISLLDESFNVSGEKREEGVVSALKDGFGFIKCADRDARMFFRYNELLDPQKEISIGEEVEFTVINDPTAPAPNRQSAIRIRRLSAGTVKFEVKIQEGLEGEVSQEPLSTAHSYDNSEPTIQPGSIAFFFDSMKQSINFYPIDGHQIPRLGDRVEFTMYLIKRTKERIAMDIKILPQLITSINPSSSSSGRQNMVGSGRTFDRGSTSMSTLPINTFDRESTSMSTLPINTFDSGSTSMSTLPINQQVNDTSFRTHMDNCMNYVNSSGNNTTIENNFATKVCGSNVTTQDSNQLQLNYNEINNTPCHNVICENGAKEIPPPTQPAVEALAVSPFAKNQLQRSNLVYSSGNNEPQKNNLAYSSNNIEPKNNMAYSSNNIELKNNLAYSSNNIEPKNNLAYSLSNIEPKNNLAYSSNNIEPKNNMAYSSRNIEPKNNMAYSPSNIEAKNNMAYSLSNIEPKNNMAYSSSNIEPKNNMAYSSSNIEPKNNMAYSSSNIEPKNKLAYSLSNIEPKNNMAYSSSTIDPKNNMAYSSSTIEPKNNMVYSSSTIEPKNNMAYSSSTIEPKNNMAYSSSTIEPKNNMVYSSSTIEPKNNLAYSSSNTEPQKTTNNLAYSSGKTDPQKNNMATYSSGNNEVQKSNYSSSNSCPSSNSLPVHHGFIATLKDTFGFIETVNHDKEIFFHFSNVESSVNDLDLGQEVEYTISSRTGPGGKLSAENVKILPVGTLATPKILGEVYEGTVLRSMRSLNPDQQEYCGEVCVGKEEEKLGRHQFGITGLINKKELLQPGDQVHFQLDEDGWAVNIRSVRKKLIATVEAVKGQYGFLNHEAEEGKKLFFHQSEVNDGINLSPGDEVQFVIITNLKTGKSSACNITRVLASTGPSQRPDRLVSRLKCLSKDTSKPRIEVIRQPKGPDGTKGFKVQRSVS